MKEVEFVVHHIPAVLFDPNFCKFSDQIIFNSNNIYIYFLFTYKKICIPVTTVCFPVPHTTCSFLSVTYIFLDVLLVYDENLMRS